MLQRKSLLEGSILRALLVLAGPIILGNILQTAYQVIDAFWVGRLGAAAIAAVSVSFPVTFLTIAIGAGLGIAGATLAAQYVGARNEAMVNHVAAQTLLMVAALSIVLGAVGFVLAPFILNLIGVAPDVYSGALGFLRVSFVGLIFVFSFAMFQALMRGVGETLLPMYITFGTVVLNFLLDPLFIFGLGSVPGAGVVGAALATLVTQALASLIAIVVLFRGSHGILLSATSIRPDLAYIKRAFLLGFPASVELSTRALGLMVLSFLISSFGTNILAAYGVGSNVLQVVTIPALGLSTAVSTLVGQNIGANNFDRANRTAILGVVLGFGVLTGVGIIACVFASTLVSFFIPSDSVVIGEGAVFIRTMAPAWGFMGAQLCLVGTFRASGNMLAAMMLALVSQWMLQFPLAYVLSEHTILGPRGLWWSFPVTNILVAIISVIWFAKGDWRKTRLTEEDTEIILVAQEVMKDEPLR